MNSDKNVTDDIVALKENLDTDGALRPAPQWLLFGFVLLGLAIAGVWLLLPTQSNQTLRIYSAGIEPTEAFDESDWVATATQQALFSYLDASDDIQIVDGTQNTLSPGVKAGADWILDGVLAADPANESGVILVLSMNAGDGSGDVFQSEIKGLYTALNDLAGRASQQVFAQLGRGQLSQDELAYAQAEIPADEQTQRAFAEGSVALAQYDGREAVKHFTEAIGHVGEHPIINSALSAAWARLGYEEEAKESAERAFNARENLSREKQLTIEGQYRVAFSDWDRAIEIYKALREFHPHNLSYALSIVDVQLQKGDLAEAEKIITEMRALPGVGDIDPRIDIAEATFWHQKGNYAKGSEFSNIAIEKAKATGETAILAAAYLEAVANQSDNRREYLEQAQQLFDVIQNPRFQSAILMEMGQLARYDNQLDKSIGHYQEAIAISERVGDEAQAFTAKRGLAIVLDLKNRLNESYDLKKQAIDYYVARGLRAREAIMHENIGISLFKLGRLNEAEASFAKALEMFHTVDDSIGIAWAPYHLSRIRSREGRLDEAAVLAAQSVTNSEKNPEGQLEFNARFEVAHIQFFQGAYEAAKTEFEFLRTAFAESENIISSGESALMLARIALRQGDFELARDYANEAAKIYHEGGATYYVLDALIVRADLAYVSFVDDMETACSALRAASENSEFALIGMRSRLRAVRCDTAESEMTAAEAEIEILAVEADAEEAGLFEVLLDAGLIRAQILEATAETQAATERARINALATASGWASYFTMGNPTLATRKP